MGEDRRRETPASDSETNLVGLVLQSRREQSAPAQATLNSQPEVTPAPASGVPAETSAPGPIHPPNAAPRPEPRRSKRAEARKIAGAFSDLASPENLVMAVTALGVGLIGLFGGWDKVGAKENEVPSVPISQPIKADPFQIQFSKALWFNPAPALASLAGLAAQERGLMVTVDVTNTSQRPIAMTEVKRAFRLKVSGLHSLGQPTPADQADPNTLRASDLLSLTTLQPGLPTRLALVWIQDAAQPVPSKLNVAVFKQTYRQSSLDGRMRYFDATETAQVTLPTAELKVP